MPIWNAYFTDLTGDDYPEICATYTFGSGIIDSRIIIYDYANGASYELSDRGYFDFTLRLNEADGYLYVDKTKYNTDELVETGRLVFKNNCIQIEGFSNEANQVFQAEILETYPARIADVYSIKVAAESFPQSEHRQMKFQHPQRQRTDALRKEKF